VIIYCCIVLGIDCNNFFLKYILWVPANHWLLSIRLALWAFSAIAATKEYYEYTVNKYCYRIGPFVWLGCFTLLTELSIIFKFGQIMFIEAFPLYVKLIWLFIAILMLIGFFYAYSNERKNAEKNDVNN
jgi:phosphatidylserine synthase 2